MHDLSLNCEAEKKQEVKGGETDLMVEKEDKQKITVIEEIAETKL